MIFIDVKVKISANLVEIFVRSPENIWLYRLAGITVPRFFMPGVTIVVDMNISLAGIMEYLSLLWRVLQ